MKEWEHLTKQCYAIKYLFKLVKSDIKTLMELQKTYGDHMILWAMVHKWYDTFQRG